MAFESVAARPEPDLRWPIAMPRALLREPRFTDPIRWSTLAYDSAVVRMTSEGVSANPISTRAAVLYGSRFGNTQRVAEALARGLRAVPGIRADCLSTEDLRPEALIDYGFIAVGGPTEIHSVSKSMRAFLESLAAVDLRGRRGFAFDTKLEGVLAGSAGKAIEKELKHQGLEILRPHTSAIVRPMDKDERAKYGEIGAPDWVRKLEKKPAASPSEPTPRLNLLRAGSESEFEKIGKELGQTLVHARPSVAPALAAT